MVSDRAKMALGFVCFHVWIRLPLDWHDNRAAMWLLGWAGYYAFRPEDVEPIGPAVFEPAEEMRTRAAENKARQALTGEAGG